jgi:hypothetical protein
MVLKSENGDGGAGDHAGDKKTMVYDAERWG